MFKKMLKKKKPRVYLGTLAITPRSDAKRCIDERGIFINEELDTDLRQKLTEIFSLPLVQQVDEPEDTDLVLDVIVLKFQSGDAWNLSLGDVGIPIMWRPKVTVSSHLYYLNSKRTKSTFTVTEKMNLNQYISRLFTWRAFFRFRPLFDTKDIEYLLYQGCYKILLKIQKAI